MTRRENAGFDLWILQRHDFGQQVDSSAGAFGRGQGKVFESLGCLRTRRKETRALGREADSEENALCRVVSVALRAAWGMRRVGISGDHKLNLLKPVYFSVLCFGGNKASRVEAPVQVLGQIAGCSQTTPFTIIFDNQKTF